jgi:hypothetical protein
MKPIAGYIVLFFACVLVACREGTGIAPEPEPQPRLVEATPVTLDDLCEEFVAEHKPTGTFRFSVEAALPPGFRPDSGDYLVLNNFGHLHNMADAPACPYYASKIRVESADFTDAGNVAFRVSAELDDRLRNYFALEGYSAKQEEPEYGAYRINSPPTAFDPKRSKYRFEGLALADANIRVRNSTGMQIDSVQVGEQMYGSMGIDGTSGYRPFGEAYRYNYVKLHSGPKVYVIQPIDYVGEDPIGNGFFTYELHMSEFGNLAIGFSRD